MSLRAFGIYDLFRHRARYNGDAVALIEGERRLTYAQLLSRVDKLAAGLRAHDVEQGDRVCILAQNSIAYMELYGACARLGAVAYPINWRLSAPEVAGVVRLADPKMLVVETGHLDQAAAVDPVQSLTRVLLGDVQSADFVAFEELYRDDPAPPADVAGTAPFVVISTAATEGVPRGAVLTHQNLITAGYELLTTLGLSSQDRYLAVLPLFHITGLGFALGALQAGGASVVMGKYDPAAAAALIDEHAVTYFGDFPPILQTMLDARAASGATWSSLRHVFGLDAPDVIQRLQAETEAVFWTGFGQSETSGGITLMPAMERPGSAGRPFPSVRLRCVDAAGNDAPTGEPGEIVVQGPVVFAGYWRDPDATAFAFRRGWHHTGDVGKLDEDGYLYYVGRKPEKELIKSGGENVYPAEVEHALEALPQVAAACVIGVPDEKYGEAVKAVVALTPGASMTAAEVRAAVSERIASYKKPRYVDFVEQLPRRDNGEIDRAAVKDAHG